MYWMFNKTELDSGSKEAPDSSPLLNLPTPPLICVLTLPVKQGMLSPQGFTAGVVLVMSCALSSTKKTISFKLENGFPKVGFECDCKDNEFFWAGFLIFFYNCYNCYSVT